MVQKVKNILCFGDSNTFGSNPNGGRRHPRDVRWTGRLQKLLGDNFNIIEEGMGGRTTVWDDPLEPDRCGIQFLPVALQSHKPLDWVIVSLGTNDCKTMFHTNPEVIGKGMERIIKTIKNFDYGVDDPIPEILIISPIYIGEDLEKCPFPAFDKASVDMVKGIAPIYQMLSLRYGCQFLDASKYASPGADMLHMDIEGHEKLADILAKILRDK